MSKTQYTDNQVIEMIKQGGNPRNGKYEQTDSLKNYFIGICKGRIYSKE